MSTTGIFLNELRKTNDRIDNLERKFETIEKKLDIIIKTLNEDLKKDCKKMGEHIDFVENVYDNVKNPLGYLCNKINYFSKDNDKYTLTDLHEEDLNEEEINNCFLQGEIIEKQ
jgi:predicted transcriptional regulator